MSITRARYPVAETQTTTDIESIVPESFAKQWNPPKWREQLANIIRMRKARDAPVDIMGCERLADSTEDPKVGFSKSDTGNKISLSTAPPQGLSFASLTVLDVIQSNKRCRNRSGHGATTTGWYS